MKGLTVSHRKNKDITILDLAGKIRAGNESTDLRAVLRNIVERGGKKILVNLAGVSHIDSSGLGELVAGFATVNEKGGELRLMHLTDRINELMVITKLLTVFVAYDDEEEAIKCFQTNSEGDFAKLASVAE